MSESNAMINTLKMEAQALLNAATMLEKNHQADASKLSLLFKELRKNDAALIFCGVGKSGVIAQKLASTFSSVGLNSFFLHPTEALHGDLGRVRKNDAIVFLSKSGTTEELVKLFPFLPIPKENRIALVGKIPSAVSEFSGIVFDCSVEKEACINDQAPTTSSTLALAMGDAMAVLFETQVGLSKEGFAQYHPGGILGKSLRMKVKDIMIQASDCAILNPTQLLQDAILEMTKFPVGGAAIVDQGKFLGILVEGDIRRTFTKSNNQGLMTKVGEIANATPVKVSSETMAAEALELMENKDKLIQILPVVDDGKFLGFIRLHDILKEGFSLKN